ncbi:hypothetical protein [Streptomyces sp. NBC_00207]|uniref:hypothetical protein n=1 Tax=Streptomyces sp. NBC_00207 TaxID=2903635 RepID=UPI00324F7E35
MRERPVTAPGVVLEADADRDGGTWTYSEYDTPGIRLSIPSQAEGLPPSEVWLDFARDEWLPEPPVLTAIPRGDGTGPTVVRTAGRAAADAVDAALRLDAVALWSVDWEAFRANHPEVRGTAEESLERLSRALEPVWGR